MGAFSPPRLSGTIATFLAWMVRVAISPVKPFSVWVKVPMVAMVVFPCPVARSRTLAASMAVVEPEATGAAPACRPKRSGGRRGTVFLVREETPSGGGEENRHPPLRWSRAPRIDTPINEAVGCGPAPGRQEPLGQPLHQHAAGSRPCRITRPPLRLGSCVSLSATAAHDARPPPSHDIEAVSLPGCHARPGKGSGIGFWHAAKPPAPPAISRKRPVAHHACPGVLRLPSAGGPDAWVLPLRTGRRRSQRLPPAGSGSPCAQGPCCAPGSARVAE